MMDSDERFKHLANDPRFRTLRKKQRKIQIDERFQSMFTDERFTLKYTKDKRGRDQKKTSADDLKRFYEYDGGDKEVKTTKDPEDDDRIAENSGDESDIRDVGVKEDESVEESEEEEKERDDEEDGEGEDSELESSSSSSSDESESEEEEMNLGFDWQPLDHDAERTVRATHRLAIQNMDWDHLEVKDLYVLINSIRPPKKVRIYVSEFGKERLKLEEVEGPKELVDIPKIDEEEEEYRMLEEKMNALKNPKANDYEDADEALDPKNQEIRERIRQYQLSRMKYYYAVVEMDSIESAEVVYKELDGMEYEGSSLELDFRFIPDDIEFDDADIRAECDKLPDLTSYKAPLFINSALQQATVKLTWDQTDMKRQELLQRAYTKEELEKDDLAAYLASETESEGDDEAGANKYKQLLDSLDEEADKKKELDVDVDWTNYSDDDQTSRDDDQAISDGEQAESEDDSNGESDTGELDLMVMDAEKEVDFEFNPDDDRFRAVYESGLYNIDPSHPSFKRTQAFDMMAEKKREKRRKING